MEKREGKRRKRRRVAWGITGSGDRLVETVEVMKEVRRRYQNEVDIVVFLSKAGDQVVKYYKLANDLRENEFLLSEIRWNKLEFLAPSGCAGGSKFRLVVVN